MLLKLLVYSTLIVIAKGQCKSTQACVDAKWCKADGTIISETVELKDLRSVESCGENKVCCHKPEELLQLKCGFRGIDINARLSIPEDKVELYEADVAEFPWIILISRIVGAEKDFHGRYATGSLIHPKVVLTKSNRIMKKDKLKVIAGDWNIKSDQELHKVEERLVKTITKHENFSKGTFINDIALLILVEPFELDSYINIICLPPKDFNFYDSNCAVAGWGENQNGVDQHILKKINVTVVPHQICENKIKAYGRVATEWKLHESFLCAESYNNNDICKGDGGAPLICPIPGGQEEQYYQAGIVAFGYNCGDESVPGLYANVANLRDWIDNNMKTEI